MARSIKAGSTARVFYVIQSGYDSHAVQLSTQAQVLREFAGAVKAFLDDLAAAKLADRVVLLAFSEFGRRVTENANGGTDHGAAAPMFIVGNTVKAGLLGRFPSLAPQDLYQGDIKYNVDFRNVYAGILENWLKTKSAPILGKQFEPMQLI